MTIETKRTKMMNCQKEEEKNLQEKIGQQNQMHIYRSIENPEIQLIKFQQGCQYHLIGEEIVFSTNSGRIAGYPYAKEKSWTPTSHHILLK